MAFVDDGPEMPRRPEYQGAGNEAAGARREAGGRFKTARFPRSKLPSFPSRINRRSYKIPFTSTLRRAALARRKKLERVGKAFQIPYPNDDKEPVVYTPKETLARKRLIRSTFRRTNESFNEYLLQVSSENVVHGKPYSIQ